MGKINTNLGSGKIILKNFSNSLDHNLPNLILNPKFNQENYYPYDGLDSNYNAVGSDGSVIMRSYAHNSPLRYYSETSNTLFRKQFHKINSSYDLLPYNAPLQNRTMKILPVGRKFANVNTNDNLIRTISSQYDIGIDTDLTSWTKYSAEALGSSSPYPVYSIPIPSRGVTTVNFGCYVRIDKNNQLRPKNFGGIFINFRRISYRSYVNYIAICGNEVPTLLGDNNPYTVFRTDWSSNATCQWVGPNNSKVKVKKLSQVYQDDTYDNWKLLTGSVSIPTFSTADSDNENGIAQFVSLHMYLAESFVYLNNNDGVETGPMFFYNPYLYFS